MTLLSGRIWFDSRISS